MVKVYLGFGANIGDSIAIIRDVVRLLQDDVRICSFRMSRFYNTSPVGGIAQADYINAVCCFETDMLASDIMNWIQEIEKRFGKKVMQKNGPRIIDIDLLLYGEERIRSRDIEVPHPRMMDRLFVLVPLAELMDTPLLSKRIKELQLQSNDVVQLIEE